MALSWLKRLLKKPRPLSRSARRHTLAIEVLEDRTVPSFLPPVTFPVGVAPRPLLRDAPDEATPWLGPAVPRGPVLAGRAGRVLQLRRRYRDGVEVGPLPRADPLASCHVGP